ncbi:hypothetical protein U1Q18_019236 [Sarracenia purpurea var. burkii]
MTTTAMATIASIDDKDLKFMEEHSTKFVVTKLQTTTRTVIERVKFQKKRYVTFATNICGKSPIADKITQGVLKWQLLM